MGRVIWNGGAPPSIGWWPASANKVLGVYRWWNGVQWSACASQFNNKKEAAEAARLPAFCSSEVKWSTRPDWWPEASKT